jgi:hypothetical protein
LNTGAVLSYFDETGRCIPTEGARVFGKSPSQYYVIDATEAPLAAILARAQATGLVDTALTLSEFTDTVSDLKSAVQADPNYAKLLKGVCVPFVYQQLELIDDLGRHLEGHMLPKLRQSFTAQFPDSHFKAVLQGNTTLEGQISPAQNVGYEQFIASSTGKALVGLYFPQALQEYDLRSQREQFRALPPLAGARTCLSGGLDICAALTGQPDLLISEKHYAPILCLSAYEHRDPRLTLMLKAYGPHLEFWCMSQMLTPTTTQVSEQWSGGITIF